MNTNQVQTEEQRIAEIKRKASTANKFYCAVYNAYYQMDAVEEDCFLCSDECGYAMEMEFTGVQPEDKFFKLVEIN